MKTVFSIETAEIGYIVDFPIEEMSDARAEEFESYLLANISRYRDTSAEDIEVTRQCDQCSSQNDVVRYRFSTYESIKKNISDVAYLIDMLGEAWLRQEDEAFLSMSQDEEDERCNRLAYKSLNGIVDDEVLDANARHYRSLALRYGEEYAALEEAQDRVFFGLKH